VTPTDGSSSADAVALWDSEAATFDEAPDHGLLDAGVRAAWRSLLLDALPPAPASVADLGCGTGTLADRGPGRGVGDLRQNGGGRGGDVGAADATVGTVIPVAGIGGGRTPSSGSVTRRVPEGEVQVAVPSGARE
jgi:hypothetical protein